MGTFKKSLSSASLLSKHKDRYRRYFRGSSTGSALDLDEDEVEVWTVQDSWRIINGELTGLLSDRQRYHVASARAFLPRVLQHRQATNNNNTVMKRCDGCVVFSDASGFTKLTETLAKRSDGAEVLSKCLNKFFTPLIDIIEAYRGDVIKFSGDALSILFEATDDYKWHDSPCGSPDAVKKTPQQLACLRASACCIEIHKKLHNFDTGEGGVRLTLHIGVGAGSITILQVGGVHGRFEYVIAGTPMEQISVAEPLAGSGETVLSPETWCEVAFTVVEGPPLTEGPPGFHRLARLNTVMHTYPTVKAAARECSGLEESQVGWCGDRDLLKQSERFIPRSVLKHLRSGNSSSINEMRSVTIIFAQIGGVDVSTEEGSSVAQQLMRSMQMACYGFEGNLNKFLVDDKGLLFVFVFGLPPLMHVDDPVRAIGACFAMITVLQGMGLCGRFGVTTGRVYCGIVGSDKRREYTVMGDTVNLSARLMANAAQNTVLIDEATYLRSQQDVISERLDPIMVKGKSKPIQIFAPSAPGVHGLEVPQLSGVLCQRGWNLQCAELEGVALKPGGGAARVRMPWRASSHLLGGASPVLRLTRWRELQQVEQLLVGPLGLFCVGGALRLLGASGSGKQELCEHLLSKAIGEGLLPLFGMMRTQASERWRAVAELVQTCLGLLCSRSSLPPVDQEVSAGVQPPRASEVSAIFEEIVQRDAKLRAPLALLGFEEFEEDEIEGAGAGLSDEELEERAAELVAQLVQQVAKRQGVLVVLRLRQGTDIFDGLREKRSVFWTLSSKLSTLALERQSELTMGDHEEPPHPILVVTLARTGPGRVPGPHRPVSKPHEIVMSGLTEDAAVELMCHCLGLQTINGGSLVKRQLREFVIAVSINIPAYIQECIQHLLAESCVAVENGECRMLVQDLNTVNIAEWVKTSMVGGTISQLESLGSCRNHIMKLATVFEGAFSSLDLTAANRVLFGKIPRILALYDQAKLLCACRALVKDGYLRRVSFPPHSTPPDRAPVAVPRWTVSNSLFRKVAGSMLLNSQKILIKRAVLIDRALNLEVPKRLRPGEKGRSQPSNKKAPHADLNRENRRASRTAWSPSTSSAAPPRSLAPDLPEVVPEEEEEDEDAPPETEEESPPKVEVGRPSKATKMERGSFSTTGEQLLSLSSRDSAGFGNPRERLISAFAQGDASMVREVMDSACAPDVNDTCEAMQGFALLHLACSCGEAAVVRVLFEHGALVSTRSTQMETPLMVAARYGHLEVVQYLCEKQNALALGGQGKLDFWERALPDIIAERDVPRPLPLPGQPAVEAASAEVASGRRRAVREWLAEHLSTSELWRESFGTDRTENSSVTTVMETEEPRASFLASIVRAPRSVSNLRGGFRRASETALRARRALERRGATPEKGAPVSSRSSLQRRQSALNGDAGAFARSGSAQSVFGTSGFRSTHPSWTSIYLHRARTFSRSRTLLVIMLVALVLALYMPDLWIACGVPSNVGLDITLSVVMLLFLMELLVMSVIDSTYIFSFFFFMDCIGTISMIWDISFFLGISATEQQSQSSGQDLTLFRATRTAKIGARAGRLSRLVKVMRFLPGIGVSNGNSKNQAEKLQQISNRLTNVLSKRVACLTILLVVVLPLFTIGLYPIGDFSMKVWIDSLSRRVRDVAASPDELETIMGEYQETLENFVEFYKERDYGPFRLCIEGVAILGTCSDLEGAHFSAPTRRSFQMDVSHDRVMASFDFSIPMKAEANMGIVLTSIVVVLMCGACLLLNYSASELAVHPLERMLASIKNSAKEIFSSVSALGPEESVGSDEDEDMDGEVALLESVVRKIGTLAELSNRKNPFEDAKFTGMKNEELGVLALTLPSAAARNSSVNSDHVTHEVIDNTTRNEITVTMQWQLEEIGITYDLLDSWMFNVLDLNETNLEQTSTWLLMNNPGSCAYTEQNVELQKLRSFVGFVKKGYLANPYHNFMHAVDVTHAVFRYMSLMQASQFLSMIEQFSILVSAISHDIGHNGLSNGFLVEVEHDLAIRYNDRSPLENMHCCTLFAILAQPGINVFSNVTSDQHRDIRKNIIDAILHTDISKHHPMVKEIELLYEMNSKDFEANLTESHQITPEVSDLLAKSEHRKLIMKLVLHAADTSNPTKPWNIAFDWAQRVLDEFFNQGDQEKKLGIPVQVLNDRDKVSRPNSQIGFIEFIVTPLVVAEVKIFPAWHETSVLLELNLQNWERLWIEESTPSDAERDKVAERIQRIAALLNTVSIASAKSQSQGSDLRPRQRRKSYAG